MKTATEMMIESDRMRRLRRGVQHLLHSLRKFARAVPFEDSAVMPDHQIEWIEGLDGGPTKAIIEILKEHPDLWMHVLPKDVILVHAQALKQITGLPDTAVDFLQNYALNDIGIQASQLHYSSRQS